MSCPLRIGYNTSGLTGPRLENAIPLLVAIGYESVALTLEPDLLDPPDPRGAAACVEKLQALLTPTALAVTIETGSRFMLDPHRKHQPTMVSADPAGRRRRVDFLRAAIDVAAEVRAESVSLWSGTPDDGADFDAAFARLVAELAAVLDHAEARGVRIAFEPEPGMLIDTMARFDRLREALPHPRLGLTLDLGHVHCLGDGEPADRIRQYAEILWNIHIEDMRRGVHEHLPFGRGEMDFEPIFSAFDDIDYAGPVHAELGRDNHNEDLMRETYTFLLRMGKG
jgi:sugar phosphate isomerase/epimerase